jgi:hypothetical protein
MRLAGIGRPQDREDAGTGRQRAHGGRIGARTGKCKAEDAAGDDTPALKFSFAPPVKNRRKQASDSD